MSNMISFYNIFGAYEDPVNEILACRTDTRTLSATCVSDMYG